MNSMYDGYSIQAQGGAGVGGATGADAAGGTSGAMEPKQDDERTGHLVQDESAQSNPGDETVESPGVVRVNTQDKKDDG